jgi:diamine N-acetyltransferase
MFIKGQSITIRAIEPADVHLLYGWENDQTLWRVSYTQTPFSKFVLEEFVNCIQDIYTTKQLRLMINSIETKETIGCVDLFEFDPQHARCGIGLFIHNDFRNRGYALECIELMKNYCFNTLYLKQIFVHVNSSNTASLNLFEKAKFEKTGLKKSWNKNGLSNFEDVWFLQFINPED